MPGPSEEPCSVPGCTGAGVVFVITTAGLGIGFCVEHEARAAELFVRLERQAQAEAEAEAVFLTKNQGDA